MEEPVLGASLCLVAASQPCTLEWRGSTWDEVPMCSPVMQGYLGSNLEHRYGPLQRSYTFKTHLPRLAGWCYALQPVAASKVKQKEERKISWVANDKPSWLLQVLRKTGPKSSRFFLCTMQSYPHLTPMDYQLEITSCRSKFWTVGCVSPAVVRIFFTGELRSMGKQNQIPIRQVSGQAIVEDGGDPRSAREESGAVPQGGRRYG